MCEKAADRKSGQTMKKALESLITLRKLVAEMEKDLGFDSLSEVEKVIILAASELQERDGLINSVKLRQHPLTAGMSRPTFFRVVRNLEMNGDLCRPDGVQRGSFILG